MSKRTHGNKEAKKPKRPPPAAGTPVVVETAPSPPGTVKPQRQGRR